MRSLSVSVNTSSLTMSLPHNNANTVSEKRSYSLTSLQKHIFRKHYTQLIPRRNISPLAWSLSINQGTFRFIQNRVPIKHTLIQREETSPLWYEWDSYENVENTLSSLSSEQHRDDCRTSAAHLETFNATLRGLKTKRRYS